MVLAHVVGINGLFIAYHTVLAALIQEKVKDFDIEG
jgi:hypothetical protein